MRFSLRSTAFTMLALATVAANAAGVPQFYFSTAGGDNSRLLEDTVTSSAWTAEYDIIVKNVGDANIRFNNVNLLVGYATKNAQTAGSPNAGSDGVTVFNTADGSNASLNTNITVKPSWLFAGGLDTVAYRGGSINPSSSTATRPYGMAIALTQALNQFQDLAVGEEKFVARIKFKDNGFYGNGQAHHDLFLYTGNAGAQASGSTLLFLPAQLLPQNWEENSRLRLVPEPGTMLALVAGIGALAARRRRK